MKMLNELWKDYRNACYPEDIPAEQNRECHQAFMAGAFAALTEWVKRSTETEDTDASEGAAAKDLGRMLAEAEEWCRLRSKALNMPKN